MRHLRGYHGQSSINIASMHYLLLELNRVVT